MSRFFLFILCIMGFNPFVFSQVDKDLIILENMFEQEKFDEVIRYKSRRIKSLSSKSLYYKGLAYFNKRDDANANRFFDLAINKGPAEDPMYFYRGFSAYYLGKYNKALQDFKYLVALEDPKSIAYSLLGETFLQIEQPDSAIFYLSMAVEMPDCDPQSYMTLASVYQQQKKHELALTIFQQAILNLKPQDEFYQVCSYNIGLIQQFLDKINEAQITFEDHLKIFPDDYQAISRLIQIYYQNNEAEKTTEMKETLYDAYAKKILPKQMQNMFCFDQFKFNGNQVMAFENFNEYSEIVFVCKHKFYILDLKGEIDFIIRSEKDTIGSDSIYMLKMIKNDTIYVFQNYQYGNDFDYINLKNAVLDVLNGKVEACVKTGDYSRLISEWRAKLKGINMPDKDGSSFTKAIIVESIREEYDWLGKFYPGYKFIMQSLIFENGQPYDVLEIKTTDGETIRVHFDISKFFGKGF